MEPVHIRGVAAIQLVIQSVAPDLARNWDGALERVGFVLEVPQGAQVGFFPNRAVAIEQLRRRALTSADPLGARMRECADRWEKQAPAKGVECMLVGWNACEVFEMNPDDLRAAKELPTPVGLQQAAARIVLQAQTKEGALDLARGLRAGLQERAIDVIALTALEQTIEKSWEDPAALAVAAGRASAALGDDHELAKNEARFVLMLMADTFGDRAGSVTGGGGDA